jgi:hypothetical protein
MNSATVSGDDAYRKHQAPADVTKLNIALEYVRAVEVCQHVQVYECDAIEGEAGREEERQAGRKRGETFWAYTTLSLSLSLSLRTTHACTHTHTRSRAHTHKHTHTNTHANAQTHKHTKTQTHKQTHKHTNTQTHKYTHRQGTSKTNALICRAVRAL